MAESVARSAFHTLSSSERQDWPTGRDFFASLHAEFEFTVDAAASPENACLPRYWTEGDEGLMQSWEGERVYMNPPYGRQLPRWVEKAWTEAPVAEVIVALIPARTDTAYWHEYIFGQAEVRFLRGRLTFDGATNVAPFPSAVIVWRPRDLTPAPVSWSIPS
jgi:site-specific DNA-methyltransferase (adenine-specific)